MLGGVLVDTLGYRRTFLVTAALQLCSVLLYSPLLLLVAPEKDDQASAEGPGAGLGEAARSQREPK